MIEFLKVCLWTQAFSILFAVVIFAGLDDPRLAGSMAGPVFLLSGALPFLGFFARKISYRQVGFWGSIVFTLFFSGPMLVKRFILFHESFSQITYYGMSSGVFHRISGFAYMALMGGLAWDLIKAKRKKPA